MKYGQVDMNKKDNMNGLIRDVLALILIGLSITGFIIILCEYIEKPNINIKILILGLSLSIIPYVIFRGIEVLMEKRD